MPIFRLPHFGWSVGNERLIKLTEISAVQLSVLTYIAMLVGVFALGYAINWMAKTYGAQEEHVPSNGIALAAYSCTPPVSGRLCVAVSGALV